MTPLAFAHPALFWTGLGLVAVPILIHLFFRRRHKVVRWAAMDFLLAALRKQKRRIEVENLILLLLRCAAILLLAIAVARPAVEASGLNPFGGGARAVVLVLDTSTSMGAQYNARTALDRAHKRAGQFLGELPDESKVTLVVTRDDTGGGTPRALLENASPSDVRLRLPAARLSYGPNNLAAVFRLAGDKLRTMSGRRLVVFVTDLQRTDWFRKKEKEEGKQSSQGVLLALQGLRPEGRDQEAPPVVILDVGAEHASNVLVKEFTLEKDRQALAGEILGLNAMLVNYGAEPAEGTVSTFVARPDGQWEKGGTPTEVTIKPGGMEPTSVSELIRLPVESEGPLRFKVKFDPRAGASDRLELDSERYLALRVRPPVRILPVRSFLAALKILKDIDSLSVLEILDPVFPRDLETHDLSRADVVLWADADVHNLTDVGAAKLAAFVKNGGGLLAYLGFYAQPGLINEHFFKDNGAGLFPMLLDEEQAMHKDDDHPVAIDLEPDEVQSHPLFRETLRLFRSPEITAYTRLAPGYPEEHVVARYDDGQPAVLTHEHGGGKVIVVTTTPDERGFQLNGSLLPAILFFNAAHYLVVDDPSTRNKLVGSLFRIPLPIGTREVAVDPPEAAGGVATEPVEDASKPFLLDNTAFPGFYRITAKRIATAGASALPVEEVFDVAANLDPAEGDLRRTSAGELQGAFPHVNLHFTGNVEAVLPRTASAGEADLSRSLLGAVIFVLLLELFLAWRFGNRRARS